jgi:hypothetical protein
MFGGYSTLATGCITDYRYSLTWLYNSFSRVYKRSDNIYSYCVQKPICSDGCITGNHYLTPWLYNFITQVYKVSPNYLLLYHRISSCSDGCITKIRKTAAWLYNRFDIRYLYFWLWK